MPCLVCRLTDRIAGLTVITGELHNQDTILRRQGYQQNNTDLGIDTHRNPHHPAAQHRSQNSNRKPHHGSHWTCPAFILCRQYQIGYQQGHD